MFAGGSDSCISHTHIQSLVVQVEARGGKRKGAGQGLISSHTAGFWPGTLRSLRIQCLISRCCKGFVKEGGWNVYYFDI